MLQIPTKFVDPKGQAVVIALPPIILKVCKAAAAAIVGAFGGVAIFETAVCDNCEAANDDYFDPYEEWLEALLEMKLSIELGLTVVDDLTKQAFNNSVREFIKQCPHLASQIDTIQI